MKTSTRKGPAAGFTYRMTLISSRFARFVSPLYTVRYGLNRTAWRTLAFIAAREPLAQRDLGGSIIVDPAAVTRSIEVLAKKEFITRETDPNDRRRIILRLTASGRKVHAEIGGMIEQYDAQLVSGLTAQEKTALARILDKLEEQIEANFPVGETPPLEE
jgi:DNA-binding MarR family transcriptional regulator